MPPAFWIPGYEERYNEPPIRNTLPMAIVGRTIGGIKMAADKRNFTSEHLKNADGYVADGLPRLLKPKLKQPVISPPLPQSILDAIREAKKKGGAVGTGQ